MTVGANDHEIFTSRIALSRVALRRGPPPWASRIVLKGPLEATRSLAPERASV
jgi:hypothetical protein